MKKQIIVLVVSMLLSATCIAEISDNGFVGCKEKRDIFSLAILAKSGASIAKFKSVVKKLEASKKCRMFKKGEKIELYTLGDKETGADIYQIAFPYGSDKYYWIDKRAVSFD